MGRIANDVTIMATGNIITRTGTQEQLFAIIMEVNGKKYKLLVKQSAIQHISENHSAVAEQLKSILPSEPSAEPTYIDIVSKSNESHIPSQQTSPANPDKNNNSSNSQSQNLPSTSGLQQGKQQSTLETDPVYDDDEEEEEEEEEEGEHNSKNKRYEWSFGASKKLLEAITKKKESLDRAVNKKAVWNVIATDVNNSFKRANVTGEQCRERYYTLKKKYRKHKMEGKKTGNSAQKPFLYEDLMDELLMDDPAFNPRYTRGSLSKRKSPNTSDSEEAEEQIEPAQPKNSHEVEKRPKKSKMIDELKDFLSERDDKFLNVLQEMNAANNRLIERLLPKESQK